MLNEWTTSAPVTLTWTTAPGGAQSPPPLTVLVDASYVELKQVSFTG